VQVRSQPRHHAAACSRDLFGHVFLRRMDIALSLTITPTGSVSRHAPSRLTWLPVVVIIDKARRDSGVYCHYG
jgi:hypothetical protein